MIFNKLIEGKTNTIKKNSNNLDYKKTYFITKLDRFHINVSK